MQNPNRREKKVSRSIPPLVLGVVSWPILHLLSRCSPFTPFYWWFPRFVKFVARTLKFKTSFQMQYRLKQTAICRRQAWSASDVHTQPGPDAAVRPGAPCPAEPAAGPQHPRPGRGGGEGREGGGRPGPSRSATTNGDVSSAIRRRGPPRDCE